MNPEILYPALKTLASNEIFIERVWMKRGDEIIKLRPLKVILKKDRNTFVNTLKESLNAEEANLSYYQK